jgi:PsbP-like protein
MLGCWVFLLLLMITLVFSQSLNNASVFQYTIAQPSSSSSSLSSSNSAIKLLLTDAIDSLKTGNINNTLGYLNLIDQELMLLSRQNFSSSLIQGTTLLLDNAMQELNDRNTTNAFTYLNLAVQNLDTTLLSSSNQTYSNTTNITANTAASDFLTYDNPIWGMQIQYPSNWSITETSYNPDAAANNTIVIISSPSKTASELGNISGVSGSFVPYLDIYVFDSKNISFDKIIDATISKFSNNENFAIHESKPITLKGNQQGYMLVYDSTVAGDEFFRKLQVYTMFDNKVYVITFTSQAASFPNYLSLVQKMVNSFDLPNTDR